MKRTRSWIRRATRRRRWRKDAKRTAELVREFVYLDEVSVFSLIASKDGMIATEITDTHASTLMAEASGSLAATAGAISGGAAAKTQASDTRTTQVLRKAVVQSTFRDLYQRVRGALVVAPPAEGDRPPQFRSVEELQPDESRAWVLDPSAFERGDLIELTVELEAEPLFQARTVVSTFLDIFEQDQATSGITEATAIKDAAALSRIIEKLGAGLVPLRAKARDYVIVRKPDGTELVVHRDVVAQLGTPVAVTPIYLVGVAEEGLFWKDLRTVVFGRSEYQVLARLLRPNLQRSWTPLKLVDVLARVVPQFRDLLETMNTQVLDAMIQSAASTPSTAHVAAALANYAELVADALDVELHPDEAELAALLVPPKELQAGSTVKQWRQVMEPIATHVASIARSELDPQVASNLRLLARMNYQLSPIDAAAASQPATSPTIEGDGPLLDTEIIAIYW